MSVVCAVSVEATAAQVVGDDDVGDGVEDELDVGGVGGARLVTVDLLGRALVLRLELRLDVRRRLLVRLRACHTHTHTRSHASNVDRLHMYMFEYVYMCVYTCARYVLSTYGGLVAWHSGRTSVSGRRTFPVLRSTCS